MNLAGLTPGHYMNYLMLLSDLRDSVLYIGNLFSLSLSLGCVCLSRFICLFGVVRVNCYPVATQVQRVTRRSIDVSTS